MGLIYSEVKPFFAKPVYGVKLLKEKQRRGIDTLAGSLKVAWPDPGDDWGESKHRGVGWVSGKRYLLNNVSGKRSRRCWANSIKCTHVNPRFRFKRFWAQLRVWIDYSFGIICVNWVSKFEEIRFVIMYHVSLQIVAINDLIG